MKASVDDADPIDCKHGQHAPLDELPPSPGDGHTVEVDWRCPACMRLVRTVSWTQEAWLKDQAKRRRT
jgi:hypothetical protein